MTELNERRTFFNEASNEQRITVRFDECMYVCVPDSKVSDNYFSFSYFIDYHRFYGDVCIEKAKYIVIMADMEQI